MGGLSTFLYAIDNLLRESVTLVETHSTEFIRWQEETIWWSFPPFPDQLFRTSPVTSRIFHLLCAVGPQSTSLFIYTFLSVPFEIRN